MILQYKHLLPASDQSSLGIRASDLLRNLSDLRIGCPSLGGSTHLGIPQWVDLSRNEFMLATQSRLATQGGFITEYTYSCLVFLSLKVGLPLNAGIPHLCPLH